MLPERRLRLEVVSLFVMVAAAFVAVNLLVVLAVFPQLRRIEAIYGGMGESLHGIAEMRGVATELRSTATLARADGDAQGARAVISGRLARLRELGAAFEGHGVERSDLERWARLRDVEIPALEARALQLIDAGADRAPAELRDRAIAQSMRVDVLLEELGSGITSEVQTAAERIHTSLGRLVALAAALLLLGVVGAVLLVLRATSAVDGYATIVADRMAELDGFASRVAHDLRSPLQTISLSLRSLARRSQDEGSRATAARAERGVARLGAMIQDLLEFARSGAVPEQDARAAVDDVLADVREELGPVANGAGVRLSFDAAPGALVAASPGALRSIVANLVENGIKYARPGGERRVDVVARPDGREIRIEVRDTGLGIPRDRLGSIFDPFVKSPGRRDSYGLGLATVKRLIEAHGGSATVESAEGAGSTFVVCLPRVLAALDSPSAPSAAAAE